MSNALISELVTQHLRERGLGHFAFVGPLAHAYAAEREEAFRRMLAPMGHAVATHHIAGRMATISRSMPFQIR